MKFCERYPRDLLPLMQELLKERPNLITPQHLIGIPLRERNQHIGRPIVRIIVLFIAGNH